MQPSDRMDMDLLLQDRVLGGDDEAAEELFRRHLDQGQGRWIRFDDETELPSGHRYEHNLVLSGFTIEGRGTNGLTGESAAAHLILDLTGSGGSPNFAGFMETGAEGTVAFLDLNEGEYRLTAYPNELSLGHKVAETITLDAIVPGHEYLFELSDSGAIEVELIDGAGVGHSFSRLPQTDVTGKLVARGIRAGTYRALCIDGERTSMPALVECSAEKRTNVRIEFARRQQ